MLDQPYLMLSCYFLQDSVFHHDPVRLRYSPILLSLIAHVYRCIERLRLGYSSKYIHR